VTEVAKIAADTKLFDGLTTVASRAAAAILAVSPSDLARREKSDHSPVTTADLSSEAAIAEGLKQLLPGVPVISEESAAPGTPANREPAYVLVDPLDGTRELLAGRDEFTVNIAVMIDGEPQMGIVAAPARGLIWRGAVGVIAERLRLAPGASAATARDRIAIRTRAQSPGHLVALISRSHLDYATEAYLARFKPAEKIQCGSSLKFCMLAEGSADIYPRLAPTSEWDVAAGQAVLTAAGGIVTAPDGQPLGYGQRSDFRISAFIARGDRTLNLMP